MNTLIVNLQNIVIPETHAHLRPYLPQIYKQVAAMPRIGGQEYLLCIDTDDTMIKLTLFRAEQTSVVYLPVTQAGEYSLRARQDLAGRWAIHSEAGDFMSGSFPSGVSIRRKKGEDPTTLSYVEYESDPHDDYEHHTFILTPLAQEQES